MISIAKIVKNNFASNIVALFNNTNKTGAI